MLIQQHLLNRMLLSLNLPKQKMSGRLRMKIMKMKKLLSEGNSEYYQARKELSEEVYHFADGSVVMEDGKPVLKEGVTDEYIQNSFTELANTKVEVPINLFSEHQYEFLESESEDLILLVKSEFNPLLSQ